MSIHRYGLVSDTHGRVHPDLFTIFDGVEAILHAGDVMGAEVLAELETIAPVIAVAGNSDPPGCGLPLVRVESFPFGALVLTHSHHLTAAGPDPSDLARHFAPQNPRVIVYGHTHRPCVEQIDNVWVVNPGPACAPRFHQHPSAAILTWDDATDTITVDFHHLECRRPYLGKQ